MTPDAQVLRFPGTDGAGASEYGRFSRELSEDELAGCFFFSDDDRARIASRRGAENRLGFAVQLGTVRYLGRFLEDPSQVPASVLAWTALELGLPADTGLGRYGSGQARWEHQAEIRESHGYTSFGHDGVEEELAGWLRARAWVSAESHRTLFARAAEHLIARRVLLPGYTTLWRLVGSACEHADQRGFGLLADTPTSDQLARLQALLITPAGRRISMLERLRRPEVEPTIDGLITALARARELTELADGLGGLDGLPVARLRALSIDAERSRVLDITKWGQPRRIATLMAFAITTAARGQDDALEHFDRLHGELLLRVKAQGERERLGDSRAIDAAGHTLADACRILLDEQVSGSLRKAVFATVSREELAEAVGAIGRLARSPEQRARELILTRYRSARRYLPALLETIAFQANDAGDPILEALDALRQHSTRNSLTPDLMPTAFVSRPWRDLVEPQPGKIDRSAYTMCALESLREGLRRRDIYITPSERFADARASLLSDPAWRASREDTRRSLSLPADPAAFTAGLGVELDEAYQRTLDSLTPEHPIYDLSTGKLPVEKLDALGASPELSSLRGRVDALLPPADLPDLVLEISAKTGFIEAFTNDHEPGARLEGLATSLCAVLVAQACNVGYKALVDESNPALREARLRYVAQRYLRPETLAAANARIVDVHARLPLAERWGGGEVASIDGLRFVVPRRTIHAAYNRRYFGRRRGSTLLGTTADHYAGLHAIVIPGTEPDAAYILDGLLDPQTSVRPQEIMTDTAGYTDVIFGLFRLLGYQYSPRLADAGGASLWRLSPTSYGPLDRLARNQINTGLIERHYDDLQRLAGSLLQRHTTASQLVRALRSKTRHLASLARALQHVGRVAKTVHLLDYCNDAPFRRRILTQLNRGESRHALCREVCHGSRGELRQRYREGQEEQLGALGLVVNAIVLYNTIYTQRALDHLEASGLQIDEADVARLAPLSSEHLTLTGRYRVALNEALRDRAAYRELNTSPPGAANQVLRTNSP